LKENEIRPTELFEEYLRLSTKDAEDYFGEENERINRVCPACDSDEYQTAFEKNKFRLVWCDRCGSLYANTCPNQSCLAEFYEQSPSQKFWANTFSPAVEKTRQKKIFQPRARQIQKLLIKYQMPKPSRVIDVGAGTGAMLKELKRIGFGEELVGIEPGPWRCDDLFVFHGFANDAAKDKSLIGSASFVMSFEVIEHVISPMEFLNDLSALAQPGGILLITGLCGSGFDIQILGENSRSVSPPQHLNFISIQGVESLLKRCGLEKISFTTPGVLDVDIVRNSFADDPTTVSNSFFHQLFLQDDEKVLKNLQKFITSNNQSSHMWILARKPKKSLGR